MLQWVDQPVEKEESSMPLEGPSMREQILKAAVQLFATYGYHASPLRDIARIAGIQAASIYYHFPGKQALLIEIMCTYMQLLIGNLERIIQEYPDPVQRLRAAIQNHIRLHTAYKAEFFIIDTEIRALEERHRQEIISLRDRYDHLIQGLLREGVEQQAFHAIDVKVTSYAIIAMCTEVATWFRPDGRLTVQQVTDMYYQIITQGVLHTASVDQSLEG
jgi:AcrR family transcriptional regulator